MTLVIPQAYASVIHSLQWSGDPEPMAVTYGVFTDLLVGPTVAEIADDMAQAFVDEIIPVLNSVISLTATEVRYQLDPLPDPPVVGVSTIGATGAEAATVLPQNSAFLVHKRTPVGGRGGRGRLYFPGCAEAQVDNVGAVSTIEKGEWNTALAAWLAAIGASTSVVNMVLLHDSLGAFAADDPATVTSLTIDPIIATQRRRLRR